MWQWRWFLMPMFHFQKLFKSFSEIWSGSKEAFAYQNPISLDFTTSCSMTVSLLNTFRGFLKRVVNRELPLVINSCTFLGKTMTLHGLIQFRSMVFFFELGFFSIFLLHQEYNYFFLLIISFEIIITFTSGRIYICHTDTYGTILKSLTDKWIYSYCVAACRKMNTTNISVNSLIRITIRGKINTLLYYRNIGQTNQNKVNTKII